MLDIDQDNIQYMYKWSAFQPAIIIMLQTSIVLEDDSKKVKGNYIYTHQQFGDNADKGTVGLQESL